MYGTGQYDYEILQALNSIDTTLSGIGTVITSIADNWLPIISCGILGVVVICILNWLVKI